MAGMNDLIPWLRAQLDTDERIARAAAEEERDDDSDGMTWESTAIALMDASGAITSLDGGDIWVDTHINRHDPARVLREVDAKRRIVNLHAPWQNGYEYTDPDTRVPNMRCSVCHNRDGVDYDVHPTAEPWPCLTLRLLALPYADQPGYRQEWAPS